MLVMLKKALLSTKENEMLKKSLVYSLASMLMSSYALSQEYPDRLIRIVVAYPAGATDTAARTVTRKLAELFGKSVVVDNKPGAGSAIGADFVQRALPDGYTLFWSTDSTHTLSPHLYKALIYEPLGFTAIAKTVSTVNVLAINASLPVKTVSDLLAYAKANPDKASYGSAGVGVSNHLAGELLQSVSGVPLVHVPYKGSSQALTDMLGGQIAFMFAGLGHVLPFVRAGKSRVIGVADTVRHPYLPDVPTMEEAGLKGYDLPGIYHAVLGPLKMPQPVVAKLNQTIRASLADNEITQQLNSQGYDVTPSSPDELNALIRRNFDIWGRIVRTAKIEKL